MPPKTRPNAEAQLLTLLKAILPKAVPDPKLMERIYTACEKEITTKSKIAGFEKFCDRCELPDLEPESIQGLQAQFEESFGKGKVTVVPIPKKKAAAVEVMVEGKALEGVIKVGVKPPEEDEVKVPMVPFPVCLPADPELVWILARPENLSPSEAGVALTKAQDSFWESKGGQKLLRDRVERSFPEFMQRVPAKVLSEVNLKRHYKEPEAVVTLKLFAARKGE